MISSLEQLSAIAVVKLSEMPSNEEDRAQSCGELTQVKSMTEHIADDSCSGKKEEVTSTETSSKYPSSASICRPQTVPCLSSSSREWTKHITSDERKYIREKIKAAYLKKMANSFDDLLETCAAIEEELVFAAAPSRLDYFKSGVQFEKRVAEKRCELKNSVSPVVASSSVDSDQPKPIKRAKTNH